MKRAPWLLAFALCLALAASGLAVAAFTAHRTTQQGFSAVRDFPAPPTPLTGQSRTNDGGASAATLQYGLRLVNSGDEAVDLRDVKVRYWFTGDGGTSRPDAVCYFAAFGCGGLRQSVIQLPNGRRDADHYVQVSFTGGSLRPGGAAVLDRLAVAHHGGATFSQDNDHSFLGRGSFTANDQVTVYLRGRLVWGTEPEPLPSTQDLEVRYRNRDADATDPKISFALDLRNQGTTVLPLRSVTVRYWFTKEAGSPSFLGFCDHAAIGCRRIGLRFERLLANRPGADHYVEVGFDLGRLGVGYVTGPIELRVHMSDYARFDERDDYSRGASTAYLAWPRVTAYVDGRLVWGVEP